MAQIYRFALAAPMFFLAALLVGLTAQTDHSLLADPLALLLVPSRPGAGLVAGLVAMAGLLHAALGLALAKDPDGPGRMAPRLIIALGLACMLCALGFPMDLPGSEGTPEGAAHIALVGLSALLTLSAAILCARIAASAAERLASAIAAVVMLCGGIFSGVAEGLGLPLAGLGELVTQLTSQLWLAGLAWWGAQRTRTGKLA
ncbi:DUF998 domain-containing protein [Pararhodobacter sp. CCB-MM2]|uniref:DUF998 domain-containing protein n=1 Tax=Pararhodobacter sp. CCB-MM2 TaxID=1786003 RepID=UPI0009F47C7B|nr:DUF998 domain-containing protein [Pararhodobacter sp. CCB-MM2]